MSYRPDYPPFPDEHRNDDISGSNRFGSGFSDGSFESLGSFNGYGGTENSNTGSNNFNINPLLPRRDFSSSGNTHSDGDSTSDNYGSTFNNNSGSYNNSESYNDIYESSGSYGNINTPPPTDSFAGEYNGFGNDSNEPPPDPSYTRVQSDFTAYSPDHGNSHLFSSDDFEPTEQDIKRKRSRMISDLVTSLIVAVFFGLVIFFPMKDSAVNPDMNLFSVIFLSYVGIMSLLVIYRIVSFVRFLSHPSDKRYYRKEAQLSVRRSRYEENRRRYEARRSAQSVGNFSVNNTVRSGQGRRTAPNPKASYKTHKIMFLVGIVMMLTGILISVFISNDYISQMNFVNNGVELRAEVTGVRSVKHTSHSKKSHKTKTSYTYYATVDYVYEDVLYHSKEIQMNGKVVQGNMVSVYIDPANPSDCRIRPANNLFFRIIGFIPLTVFGLFFAVGGFRNMRKTKRLIQEGR